MKKKQNRQSVIVGTRVLGVEDDANRMMRDYMDTSNNPKGFYTKCGDMTSAFDSMDTTKSKKKKELTEEKEDDNTEDYYSDENDDYNERFNMVEYKREMRELGDTTSALLSMGCNHEMGCDDECRIFHDYQKKRRRHYYNGEDGTTEFVKSRFGRFVRVFGSTDMVRLCDDDEVEEKLFPRDRLYLKGWHHNENCSLDCPRYHYTEGLPERFTRLSDGEFRKAAAGRWVRNWANGNLIYIRVGPNDSYEPGEEVMQIDEGPIVRAIAAKKKENALKRNSKKEVRPFRSMNETQLTKYFEEELWGQGMAIDEMVRLIKPLQKPIGEGEPNIVRLLAVGLTHPDKTKLYDSMKRLFELNDKTCFSYLLTGEINTDTESYLCERINRAILHLRQEERVMPDEEEDRSLILLINIEGVSKETMDELDRLDDILGDESRLVIPDDIFIVLYYNSNFGEKVLDPLVHLTPESVRAVIIHEMFGGDMEENEMTILDKEIIPFFPPPKKTKKAKKESTTLNSKQMKELVGLMADHRYEIASNMIDIDENERTKLVKYFSCVSSDQGVVLDRILTDLRSATDVFLRYFRELANEHPLFKETLQTNKDVCTDIKLQFRLLPIEKSLGLFISRYPVMKKVIKKSDEYRDTLDLCIEKKWSVPCMTLSSDVHMIKICHIMSPVNKETTTNDETSSSKRKREIEPEVTNKKTLTHSWKEDPILSTRQTVVHICSCKLARNVHYRRPCSSGEECIGDGYKIGHSRGYCLPCKSTTSTST